MKDEFFVGHVKYKLKQVLDYVTGYGLLAFFAIYIIFKTDLPRALPLLPIITEFIKALVNQINPNLNTYLLYIIGIGIIVSQFIKMTWLKRTYFDNWLPNMAKNIFNSSYILYENTYLYINYKNVYLDEDRIENIFDELNDESRKFHYEYLGDQKSNSEIIVEVLPIKEYEKQIKELEKNENLQNQSKVEESKTDVKEDEDGKGSEERKENSNEENYDLEELEEILSEPNKPVKNKPVKPVLKIKLPNK